jgi:hypothetical protein
LTDNQRESYSNLQPEKWAPAKKWASGGGSPPENKENEKSNRSGSKKLHKAKPSRQLELPVLAGTAAIKSPLQGFAVRSR